MSKATGTAARHQGTFIASLSAMLIAVFMGFTPALADEAKPRPLLIRIEMVTIGTPDPEGFAAVYERWLDYEVVERGLVADSLAASWGTPASAGRPYMLMRSQGTDDVFLRVVDVDVPAPHKAMTTLGWSVVEYLVQDPDAMYERLLKSPFRHIGGPENLREGKSSIRATQFVGPDEVALYLTADQAPEDTALLPRAKSFVDRPFIVVLATEDAGATHRFYQSHFDLGGYPPRPAKVGVVADALGLNRDHVTPLALGAAAEKGNFIEIDGYPSPALRRPAADGQLPPGVAIVSFVVEDLDVFDLPYISETRATYNERRSATFAGPSGELMELIEAPRTSQP